MKGLFITFEGIDGCGKSVQSKLLYEYLKNKGLDVVLTREPGGTAISEKIREIIIDKKNHLMHPLTEAFLYVASRAQHITEIIKPSLLDGKIVVCDRFLDSSIAYQGSARGIGSEIIEIINSYATGGTKPDATFFLDISPEASLTRKAKDSTPDRMESEKTEFFEDVANSYRLIAEKNKDRVQTIDATKSIEEIHALIIKKVNSLIDTK